MDYADDSCRLSRAFGTGDDQVVAQFIRYAPGARFDFHLFGKLLGRHVDSPIARVRFGAVGDFVAAEAMAGSAGKLPALFLSARLDNLDISSRNFDDITKMDPAELKALDEIAPEVEAAVTSVAIRVGGRRVVLQLGAMGAPMAAMRKCTTDLVKLWGLDPSEQEALAVSPRPKSNPANWLQPDDYPSQGLTSGYQAIIRYRLMIDRTGVPTSCVIQSAIAKGDFAQVTCNLLKRRARFEPARNGSGDPTPSYDVGKVIWKIR